MVDGVRLTHQELLAQLHRVVPESAWADLVAPTGVEDEDQRSLVDSLELWDRELLWFEESVLRPRPDEEGALVTCWDYEGVIAARFIVKSSLDALTPEVRGFVEGWLSDAAIDARFLAVTVEDTNRALVSADVVSGPQATLWWWCRRVPRCGAVREAIESQAQTGARRQ